MRSSKRHSKQGVKKEALLGEKKLSWNGPSLSLTRGVVVRDNAVSYILIDFD